MPLTTVSSFQLFRFSFQLFRFSFQLSVPVFRFIRFHLPYNIFGNWTIISNGPFLYYSMIAGQSYYYYHYCSVKVVKLSHTCLTCISSPARKTVTCIRSTAAASICARWITNSYKHYSTNFHWTNSLFFVLTATIPGICITCTVTTTTAKNSRIVCFHDRYITRVLPIIYYVDSFIKLTL